MRAETFTIVNGVGIDERLVGAVDLQVGDEFYCGTEQSRWRVTKVLDTRIRWCVNTNGATAVQSIENHTTLRIISVGINTPDLLLPLPEGTERAWVDDFVRIYSAVRGAA